MPQRLVTDWQLLVILVVMKSWQGYNPPRGDVSPSIPAHVLLV